MPYDRPAQFDSPDWHLLAEGTGDGTFNVDIPFFPTAVAYGAGVFIGGDDQPELDTGAASLYVVDSDGNRLNVLQNNSFVTWHRQWNGVGPDSQTVDVEAYPLVFGPVDLIPGAANLHLNIAALGEPQDWQYEVFYFEPATGGGPGGGGGVVEPCDPIPPPPWPYGVGRVGGGNSGRGPARHRVTGSPSSPVVFGSGSTN